MHLAVAVDLLEGTDQFLVLAHHAIHENANARRGRQGNQNKFRMHNAYKDKRNIPYISGMKRILATAALVAAALSLQAQKKPLDHSVYDSWQSTANTILSSDGSVIAYEVNPQEGDGELTIKSFGKKGREITIPRGYSARISEDSRFAVCLVKPEFQKTRRAKIAKKKADDMPKDSLAVIDLVTGQITNYPNVKGYKMGKYASRAFAFATTDTTFIPKAEGKKKDLGGPVAVYHFADGHLDTLRHITEYVFSKDGNQLALVRQHGKFKTEAGLYTVADGNDPTHVRERS